MYNFDSILKEFFKTELLFNNNLTLRLSITAKSDALDEIFQSAKINFNIVNGRINLDNTTFTNNKIGLLEMNNSNLFFKNDALILNTNIIINIKDSKPLFSALNTSKKSRKEIKNILVNLDYNFLNNVIKFNEVKIDDQVVKDQLINIIDDFSDNNLNNLTKSRRLLNKLFDLYDG